MPKITKEQITNWKKKYGEVYHLQVEDKEAYLHKPDRNTLRLAFSKAASDPLGMAEAVLDNCWLAGDEEIKSDNAYFLGAVSQIDGIVKAREGSLKKL